MSSAKKIAVIIVNYRSESHTIRLLSDLSRQTAKQNLDVFICDNSSGSYRPESLYNIADSQFGFAQLRLLSYDNPGYFGAAQKCFAEEIRKNISQYEYVTLLNSDLRIEDASFIANLLNYQCRDNVAILAPSIISARSKQNSNPYLKQRPSLSRMRFYKSVFSNAISSQLYHLLGRSKTWLKSKTVSGGKMDGNIGEVIYAGHGSCFICHQKYFEAGCDFSFGAFLFNEEIVVAENCRQKNLRIWFEPSLILHHEEHASTGVFYGLKTLGYVRDSSRYVFEKYFMSQGNEV